MFKVRGYADEISIGIEDRKVLHERVYAALRQQILNGKLAPGERVLEAKIARRIGISRTPVREALQKLETEGLLIRLRSGGLVVAENSRTDAEELFEVRIALETYMGRLAAERIQEKDLRRLEQIIAYTRASLEHRDLDRMVSLNTEFHDVIARACGNRKLANMISNLKEHILRYRKRTLMDLDEAKRSLEGHIKILESLKKRDAQQVAQVMEQYLIYARDAILASIDRGNAE
ncbi:MAG: GntR family transcriptional regulator [Firmicutes bacterium]|nr:GntR family transcriptional regulator [Bacillota bacterium]